MVQINRSHKDPTFLSFQLLHPTGKLSVKSPTVIKSRQRITNIHLIQLGLVFNRTKDLCHCHHKILHPLIIQLLISTLQQKISVYLLLPVQRKIKNIPASLQHFIRNHVNTVIFHFLQRNGYMPILSLNEKKNVILFKSLWQWNICMHTKLPVDKNPAVPSHHIRNTFRKSFDNVHHGVPFCHLRHHMKDPFNMCLLYLHAGINIKDMLV